MLAVASKKTPVTYPNRISTPSFNSASIIRTPLICVPFFDPKSLRRYPPGDLVSEACSADTVRSSMTMSFDGARPILTTSPINSCVIISTPSQSKIRRVIVAPIFPERVPYCPVHCRNILQQSEYLAISTDQELATDSTRARAEDALGRRVVSRAKVSRQSVS